MTSVSLHLTERALDDLEEIRAYTEGRWGVEKAEDYLDDIEAALIRISQHPGLLRSRDDLPGLQYYVVNRHLLFFHTFPGRLIVLTVVHASMDLLSRLSDLEPTLAQEVEILMRRLDES